VTPSLRDRYAGCLLGLACGDAVGTSVEFKPRDSFAPLTDMIGGGPFALPAGCWTDDTSMALCLAESLLYRNGFDARDQMARYANWWRWGYLSSTGECFDIGNTVRAALTRFLETGAPYAGSADPSTAGNGSLMRLAPIVLFYFSSASDIDRFCAESSRTTHGADEAVDCCRLLGHRLALALNGLSKSDVLSQPYPNALTDRVEALAQGAYLAKTRDDIRGSGYCVASLEAALWCFANSGSFEETILSAANLGDDADTTAAIAGQLAGAHYGVGAIPPTWLRNLHLSDEIHQYAERMFARLP
jgi:ADP-ribosyl-[dinitrogen reductase] hydrolase